MPNKPPVALLYASEVDITLPVNRIRLDSSSSYDPGRRGRITHREYYQASGTASVAFTNIDDVAGICDVVFPNIRGIYTVGVKVWDQRDLMNEQPAEVGIVVRKPAVKTCFGASGPTIETCDNLENMCGHPSVSRFSIILEQGDTINKPAEKYLALGHTVFLNVNEKVVEKDANGNKIPNPFPKDLTKYRSQVTKVFEAYKNHPYKDQIIMVCENEPTTDNFHSGPMSDYLAMLGEVFIPLCEDYGFKGIDGGVHVVTVLGSNSTVGEGKAADVQILLDGYAQIPGMYAVNMHCSNTSDNYAIRSNLDAVNKIYNITGHNTTCNEWHTRNTTNPKVLTDMCQAWFDAGVEHSVYITTGDDVVLNNGNTLTNFGQAYKNFIDSHR